MENVIYLCAAGILFCVPAIALEWLCWRFDGFNRFVTRSMRLLGFKEEDRQWK